MSPVVRGRPEAVAGADWSAVCSLPEQAVKASSPTAAAIADRTGRSGPNGRSGQSGAPPASLMLSDGWGL